MNTDLRKAGLSLFELGQSLGLAPPSHGYTIAEKSPEIVTAPGVYFPIKRGRVIPLKTRQFGGDVDPLKEFENTGINYSVNVGAPTQQGIEAAANTALIQPTPINIAPSPTPQSGENQLQGPVISPSQSLSGMAEYEASAARMRGIPSAGLQTRGQPTASGFNLNNMTPLNLFAPPKFREKRSSPIFRSEQKTAFEKKWKPYSDLMANITGGIPLMPRQGGGITDPAMTEEELRRLKEAFPDTISSRDQPIIGAENLASYVPVAQKEVIEPMKLTQDLPRFSLTQKQADQLFNKPRAETPIEAFEKEEVTPTTQIKFPTSTLETKYTLPGTEGTAIVGPERRFMGIQEILPGQRQYPASEDRTVSGDELARKNILSEIGAQRKEWEKEFAPRERTYYEAHPEELAEERRMEMVERANKPMVDAYMKLIEEAKSRAGGFGLMGLGRRGAREARAAAAASIPHLAQGLEKLTAAAERREREITPRLVQTETGEYVYSMPPPGGIPSAVIRTGIKGRLPETRPTSFEEWKRVPGNENKTYEDFRIWEAGLREAKERVGQNWILPNGSTAISYDGGKTYVSADGQTKPMPTAAIKVPGGATLGEIRIEKAKEQARLELRGIQDPSKPSPKEAALEGTGPYKRIASIFEAIAGGFGFDVLVGKQGFFPDIADAKQYLRSVKQMGKAALMNSSRGAIWEQQKIEELFPDPDKTFTNPHIEARKFGNLLNVLAIEKMFNNQAIVDAVTPKEIEKYRNSNNEIDRLVSFISEPRGGGLTDKEKALIEKYRKKQ